MNYGLIESKPKQTDWIFGSSESKTVLRPDRNWTDYLPISELQYKNQFDTYGCVSFSALNCIETLLLNQYGEQTNFSDRFTVVKSGTIYGKGNFLNVVGDSIRNDGTVLEEQYPFVDNKDLYYQSIPEEILTEARKNIYKYDVEYRWVDWENCDVKILWEALQYGPAQVTVYTWGEYRDGMYQRPLTRETNHAVELFNGEYGKWWKIYDHYDKVVKRLAWDYYFGSAMQYSIKKRTMFKLIKGDGEDRVYAIGKNGLLYHIVTEQTFNEGVAMGLWGEWGSWKEHPQSDLNLMKKGKPIAYLF